MKTRKKRRFKCAWDQKKYYASEQICLIYICRAATTTTTKKRHTNSNEQFIFFWTYGPFSLVCSTILLCSLSQISSICAVIMELKDGQMEGETKSGTANKRMAKHLW